MRTATAKSGSRKQPACEPRFATPRDPRRQTLGPAVGMVARQLGMPLMPWQQDVVDVALELDDDGTYHYDELDLTVPRQSGKTALVLAIVVHRLVVVTKTLGRQRVTYTAQQRQKARNKLERDFAQVLRDSRAFREVTHIRAKPQKVTEWKMSLNNGAENIQFGRGNYLQIDAPSRTAGHSDTLDLGILDEAFAHADDTLETGLSATMITRRNRQLVVLSTAGDERSYYLWRKIEAGRNACETGDHGRTAYVEYSAADDADPEDPRTWWSCMPALGHIHANGSGVTERTIEGEWEKAKRGADDGIDQFRRSYLNQWPRVPQIGGSEGDRQMADAWLALADPSAKRGTPVAFGVDIDIDRKTHVAAAWRRPDGRVQVMLTADRAGNVDSGLSPLHAPKRVSQLAKEWRGRVALGGPAAALADDVPRPLVMTSTEFAAAVGRFEDLVTDDGLRHGNQPQLNGALEAARWRPFGSSGGRTLQLKDAPDVGPLAAVVRAIHALSQPTRSVVKPMVESKSARTETGDLSTISF